MAKTKYYIELDDFERAVLTRIVCEQKESERTIMRAKILLMSDVTQPEKLSIKKLAEVLGTTDTTIQTVRTEYAKKGLEGAIFRKPRTIYDGISDRGKPYKRRIDDEAVRKIRRIAERKLPDGHKKWSIRMISNAAVEEGIVEHISLDPHLILFCVCVGHRKYKELRFVRGSHLTKLRKGGYGICVPKGKGGRNRVARIIGTEEETAIIVEMCRKAGEELLFPKLPSGLDVHALRALYAGRTYWDYVRHHPETKETYAFRGARTGLVCDRNAMRFTSRQLGHNRILVIATSYLWTLEEAKSLDLRELIAAVRPMHGSGPAETAIME